MAVGDTIISRGPTFVPAAGVEIMVFCPFTDNANMRFGVQDSGANLASNIYANPNPNFAPVIKMGLTNTWFLYSDGSASSGFTGVQIK